MPRPTLREVVSNPQFYGLPEAERAKVIQKIAPEFAALPETERTKTLEFLEQRYRVVGAEQTGLPGAPALPQPRIDPEGEPAPFVSAPSGVAYPTFPAPAPGFGLPTTPEEMRAIPGGAVAPPPFQSQAPPFYLEAPEAFTADELLRRTQERHPARVMEALPKGIASGASTVALGGAGGALQATGAALEGLPTQGVSALDSVLNEQLTKLGPKLRKAGVSVSDASLAIQSGLQIDNPDDWKQYWTSVVGAGIGSMVPFLAGALATGGMGAPALLAGAGADALASGALAFDEAKRAGATDEQAGAAAAEVSAGTAATNIVAGRLGAFAPGAGGARRVVGGMAGESLQEGAQTGVENLAAQRHYEPERPLGAGVPEGMVGGLFGGGVMGGGAALLNRGGQGQEPIPPEALAEQARPPEILPAILEPLARDLGIDIEAVTPEDIVALGEMLREATASGSAASSEVEKQEVRRDKPAPADPVEQAQREAAVALQRFEEARRRRRAGETQQRAPGEPIAPAPTPAPQPPASLAEESSQPGNREQRRADLAEGMGGPVPPGLEDLAQDLGVDLAAATPDELVALRDLRVALSDRQQAPPAEIEQLEPVAEQPGSADIEALAVGRLVADQFGGYIGADTLQREMGIGRPAADALLGELRQRGWAKPTERPGVRAAEPKQTVAVAPQKEPTAKQDAGFVQQPPPAPPEEIPTAIPLADGKGEARPIRELASAPLPAPAPETKPAPPETIAAPVETEGLKPETKQAKAETMPRGNFPRQEEKQGEQGSAAPETAESLVSDSRTGAESGRDAPRSVPAEAQERPRDGDDRQAGERPGRGERISAERGRDGADAAREAESRPAAGEETQPQAGPQLGASAVDRQPGSSPEGTPAAGLRQPPQEVAEPRVDSARENAKQYEPPPDVRGAMEKKLHKEPRATVEFRSPSTPQLGKESRPPKFVLAVEGTIVKSFDNFEDAAAAADHSNRNYYGLLAEEAKSAAQQREREQAEAVQKPRPAPPEGWPKRVPKTAVSALLDAREHEGAIGVGYPDAAVKWLTKNGYYETEGGIALNDKGREAAKYYRDMQERLDFGEPIESYEPGKSKIEPPPKGLRGNQGGGFFVENGWWSDGHAMFPGDPPGKNPPVSAIKPDLQRVVNEAKKADGEVHPVVVHGRHDEWLSGGKLFVAFDKEGLSLDSRYYDEAIRRGATAFLQNEGPNTAVVARNAEGEMVGVIMPIRDDGAPGVRAAREKVGEGLRERNPESGSLRLDFPIVLAQGIAEKLAGTSNLKDWYGTMKAKRPSARGEIIIMSALWHTPSLIAEKFPAFATFFKRAVERYREQSRIQAELHGIGKPYFDLSDAGRSLLDERLDEAGQLDSWEIDETDLNDAQMEAFLGFRGMFERAHDLMRDLAVYTVTNGKIRSADGVTGEQVRDILVESGIAPDKAKEKAEQAMKILRGLDAAKRTGYRPLARFGPYRFGVESADGKLQHYGAAETVREAYRKFEAMKKKYAGQIESGELVEIKPLRTFTKNAESAEVGQAEIEKLIEISGLNDEIASKVREAFGPHLKQRGFKEHFRRQTGIPGYETDFLRPAADYIQSLAGHVARTKMILDMQGYYKGIDAAKQPNLLKYAKAYEDYLVKPSTESAAIRMAGFHWFLGFLNPASAAVNLSQVPMVTYPWMLQYAGVKDVTAEISKAYKDVFATVARQSVDVARNVASETMKGSIRGAAKAATEITDDDFVVWRPDKLPEDVRAAVERSFDEGTMRPQFTEEIGQIARGQERHPKRTKLGKGSAALFANAEQINRLVTFVAAHRLHGKAKKGMENFHDAFEFAEAAVDDTQYIYGKHNRPKFMRGGVQSNLTLFMSFPVNAIETHQRLFMRGKKNPRARAALAAMIAITAAGAGLMGELFAEDVMFALSKLWSIKTGEKMDLEIEFRRMIAELTNDEIAELVTKGLSRQALGIDLSSRIGYGRILNAEAVWNVFDEEAGGTAADAFALGGAVGQVGEGVAGVARRDPKQAANLLPKGLGNPVKAGFAAIEGHRTKGGLPLPLDDTGRTAFTPIELIEMAAGVTPASKARSFEAGAEMRNIEERTADIRARYVDRLARAVGGKADEKIADILAELKKANAGRDARTRIDISREAVVRRARELKKPAYERLLQQLPKSKRGVARDLSVVGY